MLQAGGEPPASCKLNKACLMRAIVWRRETLACLAASSVEINRRIDTCQNKCVITYTSTGRMQVSDSEDGWVVVKTDGAPVDALP